MLLLAKNLRDDGVGIIMDPLYTTVCADTMFRFRHVIHFGSHSRDSFDLAKGQVEDAQPDPN